MFYLVRVRLFFKGLKNFRFPKNYDDAFSAMFVREINNFIEYEPKFKNFDYFTFSNFMIDHFEESENVLISLNGIVSVVISSISEEFLRKFTAFLVDGNNLHYKNNLLSLIKFDFIENVKFKTDESSFITVSPILLKNFPSDGDIFSFLENLLIYNYCRYYNLNKDEVSCKISTNNHMFQSFVDKNDNNPFYDYFFMMDLFIKGDSGLLSFAYDVGLGSNMNKGFGMLDLY